LSFPQKHCISFLSSKRIKWNFDHIIKNFLHLLVALVQMPEDTGNQKFCWVSESSAVNSLKRNAWARFRECCPVVTRITCHWFSCENFQEEWGEHCFFYIYRKDIWKQGIRCFWSLVLVAMPVILDTRGRDQEDHGSKQAQTNSSRQNIH
jgi:hypothetical protein